MAGTVGAVDRGTTREARLRSCRSMPRPGACSALETSRAPTCFCSLENPARRPGLGCYFNLGPSPGCYRSAGSAFAVMLCRTRPQMLVTWRSGILLVRCLRQQIPSRQELASKSFQTGYPDWSAGFQVHLHAGYQPCFSGPPGPCL